MSIVLQSPKLASSGRQNLHANRNERKAGHRKQLGPSSLGFVLAHVTHMRRFTHPETKHQALYGNFYWWRFWAGVGGASSRRQSSLLRLGLLASVQSPPSWITLTVSPIGSFFSRVPNSEYCFAITPLGNFSQSSFREYFLQSPRP